MWYLPALFQRREPVRHCASVVAMVTTEAQPRSRHPSRLVPGLGARRLKLENSVAWSKLLRLQDSKERTVTCPYVLHPTEEVPMVSIPKVVGVLSCGFLLCLGLSNAAQAEHPPAPSDVMKTDSVSDRQGFQSDDDRQKNVDDEKGTNSAKGAKTIDHTRSGALVRPIICPPLSLLCHGRVEIFCDPLLEKSASATHMT